MHPAAHRLGAVDVRFDVGTPAFERFLVAPGHDVAGIEDVIERYGSHHVVAKRATARELARDADERRPDGVA